MTDKKRGKIQPATEAIKAVNVKAIADQPNAMQLIATATKQGMDPDTIRQLMDLRDREESRHARQSFMAAMADFQSEVPGVEKRGEVSGKYKFATLEDILTTITPFLQRHGLMVAWDTEESASGTFTAICNVSHRDGHTEQGRFTMPVPKLHGGANASQNVGAANSYARRYAIVNALNLRIIGEDTDAQLPSIETISAEQAASIDSMIDEIGPSLDKAKFLRYAGASSVANIRAEKYADVIRMLEKKEVSIMTAPVIHCDIEQGTPEWFDIRCGIPTASQFSRIMTPTGRLSSAQGAYSAELVAQRIVGYNDQMLAEQDGFVSYWAARGHELEDEARAAYEMLTDSDVDQVGFITSNGAGASPDGLVSDNGGVEIKCPQDKKHVANWVEVRNTGKPPKDYLLQLHGSLIVAERAWWDFVSYCPGFPLVVCRVERDEMTDALAKALTTFVQDTNATHAAMLAELDPQPVPVEYNAAQDPLVGWMSGKTPEPKRTTDPEPESPDDDFVAAYEAKESE